MSCEQFLKSLLIKTNTSEMKNVFKNFTLVESPFKIKNAFYYTVKALLSFKIFKFLS